MIAVALATRGLVFTEVESALDLELEKLFIEKQINSYIYRTWTKTIPDAPNYLVEEVLTIKDLTHIWFIEEDTVPPENSLQDLLKEDADIACIDYGVNGWSCTARDKKTSEILWCGLGCTLVKREVFDKLEYPYFRTDKSLRLNDWVWIDNPSKSAYGGHDIWFCTKAREAGFHIAQVAGECRHLRLEKLGTPEINKGLHTIVQKPTISKQQWINVPEKEKLLTINGHQISMRNIGIIPTN